MTKKTDKQVEFHQLSLPLYLGQPFMDVKKKVRNHEARIELDKIQSSGLNLQRLINSGSIQSSEARLQIRGFLKVLGIE